MAYGTDEQPPGQRVNGNATRDDAQLEASGYSREMPRQFSMFSLMALAYALICTWNGFAR